MQILTSIHLKYLLRSMYLKSKAEFLRSILADRNMHIAMSVSMHFLVAKQSAFELILLQRYIERCPDDRVG